MGEAFIVRKGGVTTEQALAPTITEVSTTQTSITFTITNNDASTAVILWEVDDATPDANSIELATGATSSNLTVTGLTAGTEYDVYATANVTGKVKSNVAELAIETEPLPVYTAATGGTTAEYDDGGSRYKSHTFTSNGNFVVSTVGDAEDDRNKVDYLIVAGGGGGGANGGNGNGGGGGGTGGYRTTVGTSGQNSAARDKVTVTATTFAVTVGSGGAGTTTRQAHGNNGVASSVAFGTTVSTTGGGGGGSDQSGVTKTTISPGGGATGSNVSGATKTGGVAVTDEFFAGGNGPGQGSGAGGGGAGGAGANGVSNFNSTGGAGGNGLANLLRTGSNETRGVGGKGGNSITEDVNGANGTANTGNGGGGAQFNANGGNGGAGIVVIRYEIAPSV